MRDDVREGNPEGETRGEHDFDEPEEREDLADHVVIDGMVLSEYPNIKDLRAAAHFLGISQAGSKVKLYRRLQATIVKEQRRQALLMATEEYKQMEPNVKFSDLPREPSKLEGRAHSLTQIPRKDWCDVCVMNKSKDNAKRPVPTESFMKYEHPVIQLDIGQIIGDYSILVMIDVWTRYSEAVPLTKTTRNVSEAVMNFIGNVGHLEKVELCCDQERVLVVGLELAKATRQKMSLGTIVSVRKAFDKGRTAMAERAIQTIRNQQKTLSAYVQSRAGILIPDDHVIHAWAARHAAWLLSRFQVHSTIRSTPYQLLHGRPYSGTTNGLGSVVFALDPLVGKYKQAWRKGLWVGKDAMDQDVVVYDNEQLVKTRAMRLAAKEYDGGLLLACAIGPSSLKRAATHSNVKVKLRDLPAVLPSAPVGFEDEEADAVEAHARLHPDEDAEEDQVPGDPSSVPGRDTRADEEIPSVPGRDSGKEAEEAMDTAIAQLEGELSSSSRPTLPVGHGHKREQEGEVESPQGKAYKHSDSRLAKVDCFHPPMQATSVQWLTRTTSSSQRTWKALIMKASTSM